ncbi:MAG: hypothetical protein VZT48_10955 [Bulleidia sp.]|nr:hypothetical protein [Bulleidia sp.]
MINRLMKTEEFSLRPYRRDLPEALRKITMAIPVHTWKLYQNGRTCGMAQVYVSSMRQCAIVIKDLSTRKTARMIARLSEQVTKEFHPERILVYFLDRVPYHAMNENAFFQKNRYFQKIIEPWRYAVKDVCFDTDGFLINQGLMQDIPFGLFNTKSKGCGWIAAWNLLKINGKEMRMWDCARGLGRLNPMGEAFGQDLVSLVYWLRKQGLDVKIAVGKRACIKAMQESNSGIFLYSHEKGSHYTSYEKVGKNRFHFYNAVYGTTDYERSAEVFMQERTKYFKQVLLYLR